MKILCLAWVLGYMRRGYQDAPHDWKCGNIFQIFWSGPIREEIMIQFLVLEYFRIKEVEFTAHGLNKADCIKIDLII